MTEFDKELIDLMGSMSEEEVQTILSDPTGYLKSKNPGLWKKHQEYYLEHKREKKPNFDIPEDNPKKRQEFFGGAKKNLRNLCRELYEYRSLEIDSMYERTMRLADQLAPNHVYFIEKDYGHATIPDPDSLFNRVSKLANELLLDIYPNIEKLLTHFVVNEKITSNIIRGKISWNDTIINAIKQGGDTPITFTCISPKAKFDTPENFLLLISIYWLIHDVKYLLSLDGSINNYSPRQKEMLQRILKISERIIENTPLREISEECYSLSRLKRYPLHPTITKLIQQSDLRLARNLAIPHYRPLLQWIKKIIGWNLSRYTTLQNFGMDRKENIDTMMELWILFEVASYFSEQGIDVVDITKKGKTPPPLIGFSFSLLGHTVKLFWDQGFKRQTDSQPFRPDFVFQVDDHYAPLIMDSKNWMKGNLMEIKEKLVYYLAELDPYGTSHAMGIIPTPTEKRIPGPFNDILVGSQYPNQTQIRWNVELVSFLAKFDSEHEEQRKLILAKIYETLKKSIVPAQKIIS